MDFVRTPHVLYSLHVPRLCWLLIVVFTVVSARWRFPHGFQKPSDNQPRGAIDGLQEILQYSASKSLPFLTDQMSHL